MLTSKQLFIYSGFCQSFTFIKQIDSVDFDNINLNMHIKENYYFPSELQDSADISQVADLINPTICALNLYQLNQQPPGLSENNSQSQEMQDYLQSSVQSDGFLQMLRYQQKTNTLVNTLKNVDNKQRESVLVDKNSVELVLVETQSGKQTIVFSNITSYKIRLKFNQCPFQIQTNQMLGFLLAEKLEVVIQPWDRAEVTFAIEPQASSFGDIIENIVVTSEFLGKKQAIAPITIRFHIKYTCPKISLKYQGGTQVIALRQGKIAVVSLKANKIGEYDLGLLLSEGVQKLQILVESRGKIGSTLLNVTLYKGEVQKIKLRPRGRILTSRERGGLILKIENTQACYVIGVELIP